MIARLREKAQDFFTQGHERTILTKKNIVASLGIKGITILISVILIPMTINYANPERNGIWLTLYSMVMWLSLFDIGLGNGMKNKLAEAKAMGEDELAKRYIGSTYAIVGLICLLIFVVFCFIYPYLDWVKILGSGSGLSAYRQEISGLIWICIGSFCLTFVLNLLKPVVMADQRPAIGSLLDMIGQLLTLAGIFILSKTAPPSLIYLGWITGFAPVIVYLVATFYLFNTRYAKWKPSFRQIDFKLAGNTMNLGIKFFIAGMAALLVNQTLPFLILRVADAVEVTNFNTAFRVFSLAFNVMGIIIIPYWSSFTDAYTKQDFEWMQRAIAKLQQIFIGFLIIQVILLILSPLVYYVMVNYWIKEADNLLTVSFFMSLSVCIYVCANCWLSIHIYPLNGIGKVRLQTYSSIAEMLAIIPVAWLLGHYWHAPGVVLAPGIVYIPRMIWGPIQVHKLIHQTAKGIWNK
jgi:O-antigen/teichoic acid export membrane protein